MFLQNKTTETLVLGPFRHRVQVRFSKKDKVLFTNLKIRGITGELFTPGILGRFYDLAKDKKVSPLLGVELKASKGDILFGLIGPTDLLDEIKIKGPTSLEYKQYIKQAGDFPRHLPSFTTELVLKNDPVFALMTTQLLSDLSVLERIIQRSPLLSKGEYIKFQVLFRPFPLNLDEYADYVKQRLLKGKAYDSLAKYLYKKGLGSKFLGVKRKKKPQEPLASTNSVGLDLYTQEFIEALDTKMTSKLFQASVRVSITALTTKDLQTLRLWFESIIGLFKRPGINELVFKEADKTLISYMEERYLKPLHLNLFDNNELAAFIKLTKEFEEQAGLSVYSPVTEASKGVVLGTTTVKGKQTTLAIDPDTLAHNSIVITPTPGQVEGLIKHITSFYFGQRGIVIVGNSDVFRGSYYQLAEAFNNSFVHIKPTDPVRLDVFLSSADKRMFPLALEGLKRVWGRFLGIVGTDTLMPLLEASLYAAMLNNADSVTFFKYWLDYRLLKRALLRHQPVLPSAVDDFINNMPEFFPDHIVLRGIASRFKHHISHLLQDKDFIKLTVGNRVLSFKQIKYKRPVVWLDTVGLSIRASNLLAALVTLGNSIIGEGKNITLLLDNGASMRSSIIDAIDGTILVHVLNQQFELLYPLLQEDTLRILLAGPAWDRVLLPPTLSEYKKVLKDLAVLPHNTALVLFKKDGSQKYLAPVKVLV